MHYGVSKGSVEMGCSKGDTCFSTPAEHHVQVHAFLDYYSLSFDWFIGLHLFKQETLAPSGGDGVCHSSVL